MIKIIFTSILLSLCLSLYAAPLITSAQFIDNELTISGTGFTTHPDYSPDIPNYLVLGWENFENGQLINSPFEHSHGGAYSANIYLDDVYNRTNSLYYMRKFYVNSRLGALQTIDTGTYDYWYCSFMVYLEGADQGGGKITRLWTKDDLYSYYTASGGSNTFVRGRFSPTGDTIWTSPDSMNYGAWHRIEMTMDRVSGDIGASLDNVLQWTQNDVPASLDSDEGRWLIGDMLEDDPDGWGLDDIYCSNTMARVEISLVINWEDSPHREIQIPSEWSATDITAIPNNGTFAIGATVYLFVVDSAGVPSDQDGGAPGYQGYEITLSESDGPTVSFTGSGTTVTVNTSVEISGTATAITGRTISTITGDVTPTYTPGTQVVNFTADTGTLEEGVNAFSFIATDSEAETGEGTFTITYTPAGMPGSISPGGNYTKK